MIDFRHVFFCTATLFTVNEPEKTAGGEEDGDDFETDNEEMEVSATEEEKQGPQKRKKVGNKDKHIMIFCYNGQLPWQCCFIYCHC